MKPYQRVCLVLAHEGVAGAARRALRRLGGARPPAVSERDRLEAVRREAAAREAAALAEERARYEELGTAFEARLQELGEEEARRFYWYHTVDLGDGLVTPGSYDYRGALPAFRFPEDMRGMRVLDVGSATGFFAFEFERRGADVTSVDLPSIADWDMPAGAEREETLRGLMQEQGAKTIQELDYLHFDGPFQFCRRKLGSKIRRCHASVYDVSTDTVGGDGFDLVFLGDVLPHLFSPLGALVAVAPLCRGTLVLYQGLTALCETHPALFYVGGERPMGDRRSWWAFNLPSLEQMLRRMGFAHVSVVGEVRGTVRGEWIPYERAVIHATR